MFKHLWMSSRQSKKTCNCSEVALSTWQTFIFFLTIEVACELCCMKSDIHLLLSEFVPPFTCKIWRAISHAYSSQLFNLQETSLVKKSFFAAFHEHDTCSLSLSIRRSGWFKECHTQQQQLIEKKKHQTEDLK